MKFLLGLNGEPITSRVSRLFGGVGLIRGEYICRRENAYVTLERCQVAIQDYCEAISKLFAPDPVWYRFVEMESSEVNLLPGMDYHVDEKTTMLGLRGVRRAMRYPAAFEMEAAIVVTVARRWPNLNVLVPFVSDVREFEFVNNSLARLGFPNRVGMMAEIPSAIMELDNYLLAGLSNVTIGINDLTSLTLGAERRSANYNPLHPAVLKLVRIALETAGTHGAVAAVAGHLTRDLIEALHAIGCDNVVLHYSNLPELAENEFRDLPHVLDLNRMMEDIRRRVAASLLEPGATHEART